ncbi:hypothetical protein Zmor_024150 [Zophobas morio]|uniref:Uncharacterized protein n=1 Tax=Zophobas morio TaxID=2755281 RepID=A0AA38M7T5_9CUCU|nr:hypothetical protein Zmor_024150 [Zophobas morio]
MPPNIPLSNEETCRVTVAHSWLEITAVNKLTASRHSDRSPDFYPRPASSVRMARPPARQRTAHSASATFYCVIYLSSILMFTFNDSSIKLQPNKFQKEQSTTFKFAIHSHVNLNSK